MPAWPARVTDCPRGVVVKPVPLCGLISTLLGCPLLNSMVRRSYPAWAPVWTRSMNATAGGFAAVAGAPVVHTKGEATGDGVAAGLGEVAGDALGLAVGLLAGAMGSRGWWRVVATSRTPTSRAAITAGAQPAIQTG